MGVALAEKTQSKLLRQNQKDISELFAIANNKITPPTLSFPTLGAVAQPGNPGYISVNGAQMIGPIAFNPTLLFIDANGQLDISPPTESEITYHNNTSYVLATGTGTPDDLYFIVGNEYSGQYLILQGTNQQVINVKSAQLPSLSNIVGTGITNIVTVTTSGNHNLTTGQLVNIYATTNFNVSLASITVTSPTEFTYDLGGTGSATPETSGVIEDGNIVTFDGNDLVLDGTANTRGVQITTLVFDVSIGNGAWRVIGSDGSASEFFGPWTANHDAGNFDLNNIQALNFTDIGGQIVANATNFEFFTTSATANFRFNPNGTPVVDIDTAGLELITGSIRMGNNNITGLNQLAFNEANQTITDDPNGMRFNLPDSPDTYDFVIDTNTSISIEKFFLNLSNTRIQMLEEIAPSNAPLNSAYVWFDSADDKLKIIKNTGSAINLEQSFVGWTADADLDMGTTNAITNVFSITSAETDVADVGFIRMGNGELLAWELSPTGNPDVTLGVNSNEQLELTNATAFEMNGASLANAVILSTSDLSGTGVVIGLLYDDGVKQTFNPNNTNAGINVGANATDPTAPVDGDLYYQTGTGLRLRDGGAWVTVGGGGSQTPWTSNIDADNFLLQDAQAIEFRNANQTSLAAGTPYIHFDDPNMIFNVPTNDGFVWFVQGAIQFGVGASTNSSYNELNMQGQKVVNGADPTVGSDFATKNYVDTNAVSRGTPFGEYQDTSSATNNNYEFWYSNQINSFGTVTDIVGTEDRQFFFPIFIQKEFTIKRLGIYLTTGAGNTTPRADFAIYNNLAGRVYPGTVRVASTGNFMVNAGWSIGDIADQTLDPGLYWISFMCNENDTTYRIAGCAAREMIPLGQEDADSPTTVGPTVGYFQTETGTFATAPDDLTKITGSTPGTVPLIYFSGHA